MCRWRPTGRSPTRSASIAPSCSRAASPVPSGRRSRSPAARARSSSRSGSATPGPWMPPDCAMRRRPSPGPLFVMVGWRPPLAMSCDVDAETAGQAIVEGVLLARYRYRAFVDRPSEAQLTALTVIGRDDRTAGLAAGVARGRVTAEAVADRPGPREHAGDAPDRDADGRGRPRPRRRDRPRGRGLRQAGARRARLRRAARREHGQRRAGADDQADVRAARERRLDGDARPATSRSSARGSCTTPAGSASSRPTRCTPR